MYLRICFGRTIIVGIDGGLYEAKIRICICGLSMFVVVRSMN
jgi:hypothetical protein